MDEQKEKKSPLGEIKSYLKWRFKLAIIVIIIIAIYVIIFVVSKSS